MYQHRPMMTILAACAALAMAACNAGPSTPAPPVAQADAAAEAGAANLAADTPAAVPATDAKAELIGALESFKDIRSFHATMQIEAQGVTMHSELDFVAPDRFRMTMPGGMGSQTIIGDTMYMQAGGQVIRSKMPAGMTDKWRNPAQLEDAYDGTTVQALGSDVLDGKPVRKYLLRKPSAETPADITIWVGTDGLPLQVQAVVTEPGKAGTTTARYSRYNDPSLDIPTPQ
ncbi:LolA family protein [Luteimonas lutimaris]|uniref:DUF2092 domain-containing protein n=1 Tax=Luteimonas lutimaris TaxID=698645 RepID=A0ABP7MLK2_9GAMM